MKTKMTKEAVRKEMGLISAIADRAKAAFDATGVHRDKISWVMDIHAAHENIGLKLEDLLNADDFNFNHDAGGIAQNLNRGTGELENGFLPRFATN